MLGFSTATMNAYQNGSPSALDGEAEQTRDVPTANLATGLVDKAATCDNLRWRTVPRAQ